MKNQDAKPVRASALRWVALIALFLVVAVVGTASGVLFAYSGNLPEISALDDYRPSTITRVLAKDGSLIGDFANGRNSLSPWFFFTSLFHKNLPSLRTERERASDLD